MLDRGLLNTELVRSLVKCVSKDKLAMYSFNTIYYITNDFLYYCRFEIK